MVLECGVRWLRFKSWSCRAGHSYARVSKQASKSLCVCVLPCHARSSTPNSKKNLTQGSMCQYRPSIGRRAASSGHLERRGA